VGLGEVHSEWNMHNAGCRYGNWQPDDVHGGRSVTRHELQLPAGSVPWNAERQRGVRQPLEHCLGFDNWRATTATATAAATTATATTTAATTTARH
jgi:hypothetical protein